MSKGSGRRPRKISLKEEAERWEAAFGKRQENPDLDPETRQVQYKQDPVSGKMIPDYMWAQYDMLPKTPTKTAFIQTDSHVEYISPVTDKLISGRRQQRYDLHSTGSRIYEGREQEQKEADRYQAYEDEKLDRDLDVTIQETLNDINYQNNPPPETDKNGNAKISWTFGE